MMKLAAFYDQIYDARRGFGRKHALDIYTLMAILTEEELQRTQELSARYRAVFEA